MARRLELDISADAKDAAAALALAAKNVDHLADETDRLQREFKQAERAAEGLDKQLLQTKAATAALAREFSKTGDSGIKKELDAQRVAAKELSRLRADIIGDTEKDAKAAERAWQKAANEYKRLMRQSGKDGADTFAQFFEGGILKALANPKIAAGAGVLAAGLAVQIGATVGGAVLAGAGLTAVGLGVAGAATQAPEVGAAWSAEIEKLKKQFAEASQPFIGPTIAAAREFGDVMSSIHLDKILGVASGYFSKLVAGASTFSRYVAAGFEALVENAGPVIDVLAKELPDIGLAIKQFSKDIASGSEGGASALKDLLDVVEGFIVGTGKFIGFFEDAYDAVKRFSDGVSDFIHAAASFDPLLAPAALASDLLKDDADKAERFGRALEGAGQQGAGFGNAVVPGLKATSESAEDAAASIRDLITAVNEANGVFLSADQANLRVKESFAELNQELRDGKRTLDTNTEAGRANVSSLLSFIDAAENARQAEIRMTGNVDAANAKFNGQIAAVRALLTQLGYTKAEIDALLEKYRAIPPTINTTVTTTYIERYTASANKRGQSRDPFRAHGGPVMAGQAYIVGDAGRPEVFVPNVNGMIIPSVSEYAARARAMMGSSATTWDGGSSGGQVLQPISIQIDGREIVRVVMEASRIGQFQIRQSAVVP